ncbi:MAG: redoxin domain-containing protein [Desulfobacterales bacterium]|nr:MAG: redoxin domain-containing protein [Desulfobacterales bacterium]
MNLQEKLDAFKANFESSVPPKALQVMHRVTEDLRHSGILQQALQVGDLAPDFALENAAGRRVRSAALRADHWLVLSFYRGRW